MVIKVQSDERAAARIHILYGTIFSFIFLIVLIPFAEVSTHKSDLQDYYLVTSSASLSSPRQPNRARYTIEQSALLWLSMLLSNDCSCVLVFILLLRGIPSWKRADCWHDAASKGIKAFPVAAWESTHTSSHWAHRNHSRPFQSQAFVSLSSFLPVQKVNISPSLH
jgi:hypothetical protein